MQHRTDRFPRLHVDEPEPPATLPFPRDSAPGRSADTRDAAQDAQDALDRAQRALDELTLLADELEGDVLPFPARPGDDDGPRAA